MRVTPMRIVLFTLLALAVTLIGYLVLLALRPSAAPSGRLSSFGRPPSWPAIAIVTGVLSAVCILSYIARRDRTSPTVPVVIVVGLTATSFFLGFSSYWSCNDKQHPTFFTPLMWTLSLIKGGVDDRSLQGKVCPEQPPVALEVARLTILAAFFISVVGVAAAIFRAQSDRLRAWLAKSVIAVVDIDDDAVSMVRALAREHAPDRTVALITDSTDRPCVHEARSNGLRVLRADFDRSETIGTHRLWRHVERVYLLSPDPSANLSRLQMISERLATVDAQQRIPLIVRIDDPWLADAWVAEQFGGRTGTRWAADAVGMYEVTARRLLDQIIETKKVTRLIVGGCSPLTLALCDNLARRHIERDFQPVEGESRLPCLTLVGPDAEQYKRDHDFRQERRFGTSPVPIDVIVEATSEPILSSLIEPNVDTSTIALILVDPTAGTAIDPMIATRLAARFPTTPIYSWDPTARAGGDNLPIVGQHHSYRLEMVLPDGQAHDNWERAAMRIHERYSAGSDRTQPPRKPWRELDDFYRHSNLRQVQNAFRIVEQNAGHTWNTLGAPLDRVPSPKVPESASLEQLLEVFATLGFDEEAVLDMARAEFEDWSDFYRRHGWTRGPQRDYANKKHEKLVSWEETIEDEALLQPALRSLAETLIQLRELGYRSVPVWQPHRRIEQVTAKRHWMPWKWTSPRGRTIRAGKGSWEVRSADNESWPLANDLFRSAYLRVDGKYWIRRTTVWARPARPGEVIETPAGAHAAAEGDWVVQGESGQHWLIPDDKFQRRYKSGRDKEREGPVSVSGSCSRRRL
ncbi:MAG TPA: hypothetical protein VME67_26620 [Mycobacterium sp.]|nr:hypothetical protein [Mycobacterium sp.]HTX98089.1 hypothetical protein [Mycobacterium sp.]